MFKTYMMYKRVYEVLGGMRRPAPDPDSQYGTLTIKCKDEVERSNERLTQRPEGTVVYRITKEVYMSQLSKEDLLFDIWDNGTISVEGDIPDFAAVVHPVYYVVFVTLYSGLNEGPSIDDIEEGICSSKLKDAEKHGVKVIDEAGWFELVGKAGS